MPALHHVGAGAPGQATPNNREALALAGAEGFKGQAQVVSLDCAAKLIALATARAELLGIAVHERDGGTFLLRAALGPDIGIVHGLAALLAIVEGFEAVQRDVRELLQRARGAQ